MTILGILESVGTRLKAALLRTLFWQELRLINDLRQFCLRCEQDSVGRPYDAHLYRGRAEGVAMALDVLGVPVSASDNQDTTPRLA